VRLIHRERPREDPLEEGECYDHSYGEHLSDHVEVVHLEPAGIRVEIPVEVETEHHVTTERLKDQFEDRLPHAGRAVRATLARSLKRFTRIRLPETVRAAPNEIGPPTHRREIEKPGERHAQSRCVSPFGSSATTTDTPTPDPPRRSL
jgi:hypothetical protein